MIKKYMFILNKGMYKFKSSFSYIFILVIGLLSTSWFRGRIIALIDYSLRLSPSYLFYVDFFVWKNPISAESANSIAQQFPRNVLYVVLEHFGFSILYSEMIEFYIIFTLN